MTKTSFINLPASEQDKSKSVRFHDDEKNGVTVCSLYDRWNDRTAECPMDSQGVSATREFRRNIVSLKAEKSERQLDNNAFRASALQAEGLGK